MVIYDFRLIMIEAVAKPQLLFNFAHMKKLIFLIILSISGISYAQNNTKLRQDGPYIIWSKDSIKEIRTDSGGNICTNNYSSEKNRTTVVFSDDGKTSFKIDLHSFTRTESRVESPDKIFVISDAHGDLNSLIQLLKLAGVINNKLEWRFKKNHLVVLGDIADRGTDVTALYWLIYKLENEALKSGGKIHFLIGNHENMLLRGDSRYANKKYLDITNALSLKLHELFGKNSEIGKWLRTKNTIQIIGKTLFVHGGINKAFADKYSEHDFNKLNEALSENLDIPKQSLNTEILYLFDTNGPIWYRGLVLDTEKYSPSTEDDVITMLGKFNINRIVVGHTTVKSITFRYKNKVIAIDCESEKRDHLSAGIMIHGDIITEIKNQ